jgi:RNA polymerase sigma-70 factor (ECF subfamily)
MEGLDERQRSALELRYVRGAGRDKVGAELGLSDGGTKNLLERVKAKLRECVERRLSHDA